MALEHAILVSLAEKTASGYDLARRFDASIGHFWKASHQQIYKVLRRMETDGWVIGAEIGQGGRPDKRSYSVTAAGRTVLTRWLRAPVQPEAVRHELAVKIRGVAFDDAEGRAALVTEVRRYRVSHEETLERYVAGERRDFPDPETLNLAERLQHVVLRGGIAYEQMVLEWLDDVLTTLTGPDLAHPSPPA
jgi:DNA-binding PadR family transcriptional regulator